ncbi:MAG: metal-dependent transcriptional regulator [Oscillospiraceae bacterium]|nr:metal-dependent transcriptional regulator [Oscillospiraceae bacterium]
MYQSGEDYLETILILCSKNSFVRSIDIANELNYTKPSISRAMKKLKEQGFVNIGENGSISLTEQGKIKAEAVFSRHKILHSFLVEVLGVSENQAEEDACKIEHIISQETYEGLKKHLSLHKNCLGCEK